MKNQYTQPKYRFELYSKTSVITEHSLTMGYRDTNKFDAENAYLDHADLIYFFRGSEHEYTYLSGKWECIKVFCNEKHVSSLTPVEWCKIIKNKLDKLITTTSDEHKKSSKFLLIPLALTIACGAPTAYFMYNLILGLASNMGGEIAGAVILGLLTVIATLALSFFSASVNANSADLSDYNRLLKSTLFNQSETVATESGHTTDQANHQ